VEFSYSYRQICERSAWNFNIPSHYFNQIMHQQPLKTLTRPKKNGNYDQYYLSDFVALRNTMNTHSCGERVKCPKIFCPNSILTEKYFIRKTYIEKSILSELYLIRKI